MSNFLFFFFAFVLSQIKNDLSKIKHQFRNAHQLLNKKQTPLGAPGLNIIIHW